MAGDAHGALKHDPAIERWYRMREDMYKKFRFTRPATQTGLILMVFVPGVFAWVAARQDLKWNWTAKRKGESLQRVASVAKEAVNDANA